MSKQPLPLDSSRLSGAYGVKRELAESVLRSFGSLRLRVTGYSMIPSLWPGDLVLVEQRSIGEVFPGDIVTFVRHGRLISHRVVRRTGEDEGARLITRGDAARAEDSAVSAAEALGKVRGIERGSAWIEPGIRLSFPARLLAALVARCGPAGGALARLRAMAQQRGSRQEALCTR